MYVSIYLSIYLRFCQQWFEQVSLKIQFYMRNLAIVRSSHEEIFLRNVVLKICCKFTGDQPCQCVISLKLQSNFIEIKLRHLCSLVNLLHIFRTTFHENASEWLILNSGENVLGYNGLNQWPLIFPCDYI